MGISLGLDLGLASSERKEISGTGDEQAFRDVNKRLVTQPNWSLKH
jgi:hypothetical protein